MSQPPSPYDRQYNFTNFQSTNPSTPLPGQKVDQELNAVRTALNATISRLGEAQADDGKIRNSALNLTTIAEATASSISASAISSINAAGSTQLGLVNTAGATQVTAVNAAGTANLASLNALINSTNATNAANAATAAAYSATQALNSKNAAAASATEAFSNAGYASSYASAAEVSKVNALALAEEAAFHSSSSASSASLSQLAYSQASGAAADANESKLAALDAKGDAENAAAQALSIVNNASAEIIVNVQPYVTAASNSASNAAISEANALTSRNQAGTFATTATNSASAAAISASSAATSAAAAATFNPANFAPISHTHAISGVTGLQSALDGKLSDAPSDSQQYVRQNGAWASVVAGASWGGVTGTITSQTDLVNYVEGQPNAYALRNASIKEYSSPITKELQVTTDFRIDLVCLDISKQGKTVNFSTSGSYSIYTGSGSIDISYNNADDVATICSNVNSLFPGFTLTFTDLSYNGPYYTFDPGYSFVLERYSYPVSINSGEEVMFKDHMRTYVLNEAVSRGASGSWDGYALTLTGMNGGTPDFTFSNPWVTYAYSKADCDAYFTPYSWVYANFYTQTQGDGRYARLSANNTYTAGGQLFAAATTTYPTISIPHGVAPTALQNGYMWSTTSGLFMRINGVTQTMATLAGGTFTGRVVANSASSTTSGFSINHGTADPSAPADGDIWFNNAIAVGLKWRSSGVTYTPAALSSANTFTGNNTFSGTSVSVGTSTAASTINIGTGATLTATTKAINIGTNGVAGSTTNVTIGSSAGTNAHTIYGPTTINGATTVTAGAKVTVSHSAASAGLRVAPVASGITSPVDGDVFLNSTAGTNQIIGMANGIQGAMTACRAFVNFNGSGTVAMRNNFNVSSITDNGVGDYTVNFTNAMIDADYSCFFSVNSVAATQGTTYGAAVKAAGATSAPDLKTTTQVRFIVAGTGSAADLALIMASFFR